MGACCQFGGLAYEALPALRLKCLLLNLVVHQCSGDETQTVMVGAGSVAVSSILYICK